MLQDVGLGSSKQTLHRVLGPSPSSKIGNVLQNPFWDPGRVGYGNWV